MIVTEMTKNRGAKNEIKNPTLNASIIWESATSKKNKLKKYLNWLNKTNGKKLYQVYFVLTTELRQNLYRPIGLIKTDLSYLIINKNKLTDLRSSIGSSSSFCSI